MEGGRVGMWRGKVERGGEVFRLGCGGGKGWDVEGEGREGLGEGREGLEGGR